MSVHMCAFTIAQYRDCKYRTQEINARERETAIVDFSGHWRGKCFSGEVKTLYSRIPTRVQYNSYY